MAVEFSQERSAQEQPNSLSRSGVIFEATGQRKEELTREERVRVYYATQLADGNLDALAPRYRIPDEGSDHEPWRDILVADPLSDPQVGVLASLIRTARGEGLRKK